MEPEPDIGFSDLSIGDAPYGRGLEYSNSHDDRQFGMPSSSQGGYYEHPDVRRLKDNTVPFVRNYSDPLPMATRKPASMPPPPDMKRNESTFVMDISPSVVGWIIGRSGMRIKEIQAQTGCKMWVDQDVPNDQPRKIYFHGNKANIDAAVTRVSDLVQTAPILASTNAATGKGLTSTIVDCPVSLVGLLIGKRGWTIKKIQQASGAQISINQSVREGLPRKIIVSGDESAVANALHLIDEVLRDKSLMGDDGRDPGLMDAPGHYPSSGPPHYEYGGRGRSNSPHYDPRMHGGAGVEHGRGHYDYPPSPANGGGRYPPPPPMTNSPIRSRTSSGHSHDFATHEYGAPYRGGRGQGGMPPSYEPQQHLGPAQGRFSPHHGYDYQEGNGAGRPYPGEHSYAAPRSNPQHQQYYPPQQPQQQQSQYSNGGSDEYIEYNHPRSRTSSDTGGSVYEETSGRESLLTHVLRNRGGSGSPSPHGSPGRSVDYAPPAASRDSSPYRGYPAQHSNVLNVAHSEYPSRGMSASPIEYPPGGLARATQRGSLSGSPVSESRVPYGSPYGSPHHRALAEPRLSSSPANSGPSDLNLPQSRSGVDAVGNMHRAQQYHDGYHNYGAESVSENPPGFDPAMRQDAYGGDVFSTGFSSFDDGRVQEGQKGQQGDTSRFFLDDSYKHNDDDFHVHQSEQDIDNLLHSVSSDNAEGRAHGRSTVSVYAGENSSQNN